MKQVHYMARRHRVCFHGATYHVMARGNRKSFTFVDDVDRNRFLKIVAIAVERFGAICYAYCLMGNHFHLVIHTPRANISQVMQHIDGLYTQYANWRHHLTGHVFEGRYTDRLIGDDCYLQNAIAYVVRNPVDASLVADAADWKWSSYRATMGLCASPAFLTLDWLPAVFGASTLEESRRLFANHVREGSGQIAEADWSIIDGSSEFKRRARSAIGATLYRAALPRSYRAVARPPLTQLFGGIKKADRRTTILRAQIVHGYLLSEIANHLDLHPTTISRIVNRSGTYRLTRS